MKKELKELANKYRSLSDAEKIDLEVQAHGQTVSEWGLNRSEELTSLLGCGWFNLEKLGVKIGGDGRLRIVEGVISEIPEDETKQNLKSASDLIAGYLSNLIEFLENPELIKSEPLNQDDSDEWGTEEFLLGLLGRRRFDLFE
jgi:hypothetical protein